MGGITDKIYAPHQLSYESEESNYLYNNLISMYNISGYDSRFFMKTLDVYISHLKKKEKTGKTEKLVDIAESLKDPERLERLRISYMFTMDDYRGGGC